MLDMKDVLGFMVWNSPSKDHVEGVFCPTCFREGGFQLEEIAYLVTKEDRNKEYCCQGRKRFVCGDCYEPLIKKEGKRITHETIRSSEVV